MLCLKFARTLFNRRRLLSINWTFFWSDPAGPLFTLQNPNGRLASTDADYVEIIHTNGGATGIGIPIGHAGMNQLKKKFHVPIRNSFKDFFPNSGRVQPGCLRNFCSHGRAPRFFIESINSNNFYARSCGTIDNLGRCRGEFATMGGEPSNSHKNLRGIFHLTTNRLSPYARGRH